jgi:hypothetical protein
MDRRIMRRLFLPLVCFILLAFVSSTGARMSLMIVTPQTPAAGGTCPSGAECFEGVGAPANWSGTGDFDEAVIVLEGSESLQLDNTTATYDPSFNESGVYWTYYVQLNDGSGARYFMRVEASNTIGEVWITASEEISCRPDGGTTVDSAAQSTGTTLKFKTYVKRDSGGTDGTVTVWKWNGSSWDSLCTSADGTRQENIDRVDWFGGAAGDGMIVDAIKNSTSDIASPD